MHNLVLKRKVLADQLIVCLERAYLFGLPGLLAELVGGFSETHLLVERLFLQ